MTAEGIAVAVGPGCSSLGWPFCWRFVGWIRYAIWWWWMLSFSQSVARALLLGQQLARVCCATREAVAVAVASRA
jgi:hypothetical protein